MTRNGAYVPQDLLRGNAVPKVGDQVHPVCDANHDGVDEVQEPVEDATECVMHTDA